MAVDPCPDAETWRTALSARLDGEDSGYPDAVLDEHVARCASCARWNVRLLRLVEQMGSTPAPDLTLHLIGVAEAHICGCHRGDPCECTDCRCESCTCARGHTGRRGAPGGARRQAAGNGPCESAGRGQ